jgi:signal transduction histidine kinase/CheY-like chemotaxis protein
VPERALETAARDGRFEAEGWRVRKDGSRFWASVIIDPIRDEHGALLGFTKVTRDATEKHALEEARERLLRGQNLESVGRLTGGVAHEFNNLLTVVLGSLSLISQRSPDPHVQRLLQTADRAGQRGAKLTSQLLSFSRRQTLKPEPSNVNDLISVFELLLRQAVGELVEFELRLDPAIWLLEIDQGQFQSAVLNLVMNARDAMSGRGGTLTLETRNVQVDAATAARLGEISPGAYVVVSVTDTGLGMTEETQRRAIEPFYTTKEIGDGPGLGLSQVYGFVRQSNGQIEIQSRVGQGTTVRIYLPRLLREVAESAGPVKNGHTRKPRGSVLVVEDDPDVLEIAIESLEGLGYKVYSADNAANALTILHRDVPIDVLFTDVVMPNMTGVELARQARLLRPSLRVLLSSGYARDALSGREAIPQDIEFIAKPYPLPVLADRLGSMIKAVNY